jgi:mannan endo-1,4-beta-mannosidase
VENGTLDLQRTSEQQRNCTHHDLIYHRHQNLPKLINTISPCLLALAVRCIMNLINSIVRSPHIGCPFVANGVNIQPSYYNEGNVTFGWDLMNKYQQTIQTIRIKIEPDKVKQGYKWIQEATSRGYNVIAAYHHYFVLGSDDPDDLDGAGDWWTVNYPYLSSAGPFTINLVDEWGSSNQTAASYATSYNRAISRVRAVYSGPIVIDLPDGGQDTRTASRASSMITDQDIILSTHIYPYCRNTEAGRECSAVDMDELKLGGRPCIVGEFGVGDGPVDVIKTVTHALDIGFCGVLAWAWNGDRGEMNMVNPAWYENALAPHYVETKYFTDVLNLL